MLVEKGEKESSFTGLSPREVKIACDARGTNIVHLGREVFKYAVTELELPSPEERRGRIEEFLERFKRMAGEGK